MYEFPDDVSFGIETCSNVLCHSLSRVVLDVFHFCFFPNILTQRGDSE